MASEAVKKGLKSSDESVKGIAVDVDNYAALEAITNQQGGKILIATVTADALASIEGICGGYKKLSHPEIMALAASLKANVDMLRTLTRSGKNKDMAMAALEEALREED